MNDGTPTRLDAADFERSAARETPTTTVETTIETAVTGHEVGVGECEYCGEDVDPDEHPTTDIPSATLIRCPECDRWSEINR